MIFQLRNDVHLRNGFLAQALAFLRLSQDFLSKLNPAPLLHGVRFTSKGFGIQWEETAGAATRMKLSWCGKLRCLSGCSAGP